MAGPPPEDASDSEALTGRQSQTNAGVVVLADRQNGVVSHRQLIALGYTHKVIRGLVAYGFLQPLFKGVYAVGRRQVTPNGYRMAAVLACKPPAYLSHFSAAAVWEIWSSRSKPDVTVVQKRRSLPKIRVHYTSVLHPQDITTRDGIPVTSVARTLLDLAADLTPTRVRKAVDEAARRGLLDLLALDRAIGRSPKRRGTAKLRAILSAYRPPPDTHSQLETAFWELIRDAGIPRPQVNVMVAAIEVDFYWPATKLVVELDSRRYHSSPHEFENDRLRDAKLLRVGCRTMRVTHARMRDDRPRLLDDVRALATRPRASPRAARRRREPRPGIA